MATKTRDILQSEQLLTTLAEQLKLPLVQIRHAAEMIEGADSIDQTALAALRLIDGYLLSLRNQSELMLEPVSVSSLLYDTADALVPYAKQYGCTITMDVAGKYEPVIAERQLLASALMMLGYGFMGALAEGQSTNRQLTFMVRRRSGGIATGVYSKNDALSGSLLGRARRLQGRSHQPLAGFTSDSGAGILIADRLFNCLGKTMRVSRNKGLYGLAATFDPSRQLSLV